MNKGFIILSLTVVLGTLAGCETYNELRSQFILSKGWVGPTKNMDPPPLYCYETIGEPECYDHALPGQDRRLISAYFPKPVKICPPQHDTTVEIESVSESFSEEEIDVFVPEFHEHGPVNITPI